MTRLSTELVAQLVHVPWAELARLAATILCCLLTWALTKHWYAREWLRWAPEKARDVIAEYRREQERLQRQVGSLRDQLAMARGKIAAAKARLGEAQQLELVEGKK